MDFEETVKWSQTRKDRESDFEKKFLPVIVIILSCILFIIFYIFYINIVSRRNKMKAMNKKEKLIYDPEKLENEIVDQQADQTVYKMSKHKETQSEAEDQIEAQSETELENQSENQLKIAKNESRNQKIEKSHNNYRNKDFIYVDEEGNIIDENNLDSFEIIEEILLK